MRRIEAMNVSGAERHWALIPPDLGRRVRPRVARVGDGLLTLMEKSDSLRMNRVVGLGHRGEARESMIDALVATYRDAGLGRFAVMLAPGPQRAEIARWLRKRGFTRRGGHTVLLRDCRQPVPPLTTTVRVVRARRAERAAVVAIHAATFRPPPSRMGWEMAAASAPGYEHYLAFVGATPIAVGSLRLEGRIAWLGGGATRTCWRRLGAHAALIAARLRRAARRGCIWAWAETALPVPGRPQGSFRNLLRLGFRRVAERPAFVWHAPGASSRRRRSVAGDRPGR